MIARLLSWWQFIKTHRITIQFIAIFLAIAIILILIGYLFDWTGFNVYTVTVKSNATSGTTLPTNITVYLPNKTLYDWLQLLIIPAVLAVAGYFINLTISRGEQEATEQRDKTERDIALDRQHEATLREYIDKMSNLILHENLIGSAKEDEVRFIARLCTAQALSRLDYDRKTNVVELLSMSKLIEADNILDLSELDLIGVDLSRMNLSGLNFSNVRMRESNLNKAKLVRANLTGVDLKEADLSGSDLKEADLSGANLRGVDLTDAVVTDEQLAEAKSLKGATMPV